MEQIVRPVFQLRYHTVFLRRKTIGTHKTAHRPKKRLSPWIKTKAILQETCPSPQLESMITTITTQQASSVLYLPPNGRCPQLDHRRTMALIMRSEAPTRLREYWRFWTKLLHSWKRRTILRLYRESYGQSLKFWFAIQRLGSLRFIITLSKFRLSFFVLSTSSFVRTLIFSFQDDDL